MEAFHTVSKNNNAQENNSIQSLTGVESMTSARSVRPTKNYPILNQEIYTTPPAENYKKTFLLFEFTQKKNSCHVLL